MPHRIRPMYVQEEPRPFDKEGWIFEAKFDGYRAVAERGPTGVQLYSRKGSAMANRYPPVAGALRHLGTLAVMDGEIVVMGPNGKPDFQALREHRLAGQADLRYFVFDLLWLEGHDLTGLPLLRRKALLRSIVPADGLAIIQYVDHIEEEGRMFFDAIVEQGLEGMVGKKADSPYRIDDGTPRTRRKEWIKVKHYIRHGWDEKVIRGPWK